MLKLSPSIETIPIRKEVDSPRGLDLSCRGCSMSVCCAFFIIQVWLMKPEACENTLSRSGVNFTLRSQSESALWVAEGVTVLSMSALPVGIREKDL